MTRQEPVEAKAPVGVCHGHESERGHPLAVFRNGATADANIGCGLTFVKHAPRRAECLGRASERDVNACDFASFIEFDGSSLGFIRGCRMKSARVITAPARAVSDFSLFASLADADQITTRGQPEKTINPSVVRLRHKVIHKRRMTTARLRILIHEFQVNALRYDGRSLCVRDAARDDAAALEDEVYILNCLALGRAFDGFTRLAVETIARPDIRGRNSRDAIAARLNIHQLVGFRDGSWFWAVARAALSTVSWISRPSSGCRGICSASAIS